MVIAVYTNSMLRWLLSNPMRANRMNSGVTRMIPGKHWPSSTEPKT